MQFRLSLNQWDSGLDMKYVYDHYMIVMYVQKKL
jgi:hypothetical protein